MPLSAASGTGNANFVYAMTLAHALSTGWLVSDLLGACLAWDYTSKHGKPLETPKQGPADRPKQD